MPTCSYVSVPFRQVYSGDLRFPIQILTRSLNSGILTNNNIYAASQFIVLYDTFAAIITSNQGQQLFDGVNSTTKTSPYIFLIRYLEGITIQNFIQYDDTYYRIVSVVNMDQRNRFLQLNAEFRGDSSQEATHA